MKDTIKNKTYESLAFEVTEVQIEKGYAATGKEKTGSTAADDVEYGGRVW